MARVLGARRLSHGTDASTSIERQGESIEGWARPRSHTIVHMTDDTDVSGSVSPFDRADLGRWLKPAFLGRWDVLVVTKIDRLSRSLLDFVTMLEWLDANGKTLVVIESDLDFSTPMGRFVAKILALFAEFERDMMSSRRADASRKIAASAGWHGGHSTEWGYQPVQRDGRWVLEPDPDLKPRINAIVLEILDGKSVFAAADDHGLDPASLMRRLRRPSLYGLVIFKGEIVRGPDGMPLMREPVLDRPTWNRLQARLDSNSRGKGTPRDASPWLHVIYCGECGHPLHLQRYTGRPNRYYTHKKSLKVYRSGEREWCPASVQGQAVESQIDARIRRVWHGQYAVESVEIPGEDHTEELRQVEEAIADWEAKALMPGTSADSILRIMDGLNATKQAIIDAGVVTEPTTETVTSDLLLTDLWTSQPDDHARGALLRRMGYRIYVKPDGRGKARIRVVQGSTWPLGFGKGIAAMLDPYAPEYDDNGNVIGRERTS